MGFVPLKATLGTSALEPVGDLALEPVEDLERFIHETGIKIRGEISDLVSKDTSNYLGSRSHFLKYSFLLAHAANPYLFMIVWKRMAPSVLVRRTF